MIGPAGAALEPRFRRGFVYSEALVDYARLVLLNALDAHERGAEVLTRTRCSRLEPGTAGWRASLEAADGRVIEWRNAPDGTGAAGQPPGPPSGTVLPFGRFIAWSIGEIARHDPGYLDWLDLRPEGAPYRTESQITERQQHLTVRLGAVDTAALDPPL